MRRELAAQARRSADANSARLREMAASGDRLILTVSSVTAAGAADGVHATVAVLWRDEPITVSGYNENYTPGVGHRVKCDVVKDQLLIDYRIVGQP